MSDTGKQLFEKLNACDAKADEVETNRINLERHLEECKAYMQLSYLTMTRHVGVALATYENAQATSFLTEEEKNSLYIMGNKIKAGFAATQNPVNPLSVLVRHLQAEEEHEP